MSKLPDEFDTKRELDGWLEENIKDHEVCYKEPDECGGCDKYVLGADQDYGRFIGNLSRVNQYTENREDALDLLENFCEVHEGIRYEITESGIDVFTGYSLDEGWRACENFNEQLDPLAICLAIYRAYKKLEEE